MTTLLVVTAAALLVAWRRKRRHSVCMNRSRRWSSLFAVIGILTLHLLVGQFGDGKLRVYRNAGSGAEPRFDKFTWFLDGQAGGQVPAG